VTGPRAVAADGAGNLYFATWDEAVLRLDAATGVFTLVAGSGARGFSGDNGPASTAELNQPQGLALDAAGDIYIADTASRRTRHPFAVATACSPSATSSLSCSASTTSTRPGLYGPRRLDPCTGGADQNSTSQSRAALGARLVSRPPASSQGELVLGSVDRTILGEERVPVYLDARQDLPQGLQSGHGRAVHNLRAFRTKYRR
jgi:hypothetical protein